MQGLRTLQLTGHFGGSAGRMSHRKGSPSLAEQVHSPVGMEEMGFLGLRWGSGQYLKKVTWMWNPGLTVPLPSPGVRPPHTLPESSPDSVSRLSLLTKISVKNGIKLT